MLVATCTVNSKVIAIDFLPQNFGNVVGTYEWYLSFYECRPSGNIHSEVPGTLKPYFLCDEFIHTLETQKNAAC